MPKKKLTDLLRRSRTKRAHAADSRARAAATGDGRSRAMFEQYALDLEQTASELEAEAGEGSERQSAGAASAAREENS